MNLTEFQDKTKLTAVIHQIYVSSHFNTTPQISERISKVAVQQGVPCILKFLTFNVFVPQQKGQER